MQFETTEQKQMIESVRKLALSEIPKYQLSQTSELPLALFNSFSQLGLSGLSIDEAFGGISADCSTISLVMEEIAAVDLGAAIFLSVHCMVSGLISKHGTNEQKKRLLPNMAKGQNLAAFALTEPSAGSDASALKTSYKSAAGGYALSGEKCYITSAGWAGIYLIFARRETTQKSDGISAFILEIPDLKKLPSGLSIGKPEHKMGAELSPIASLSFDNLFIPCDNLIGKEEHGYQVALSGLAGGRVNISACANGISRTAITLALKHLSSRQQFGNKLIEFQGLQFILADMHNKLEAARLLTKQAAENLESDPKGDDSRLAPSVAKCFATDAAMSITTDAVQLLGGAGYIEDYKVEKLMRDAKMLQIVEGTNQIQRIIIAREMQKKYL